MGSSEFVLRCELRGHVEDVRCLSLLDNNTIATGSRDKTIKLWAESSPTEYTCTSTLVGHTDFVSALTFAAPGTFPFKPEGALISGARDSNVIIWDTATASPVNTLTGHEYQVSSVAVTTTGKLVSASLDKTLRLWDGSVCLQTLEGHAAAVLSVVTLPTTGDIISGSGDCTIRVWDDEGKCTKSVAAHSDSVRGLAVLPGIGVISGSHDTTVKVWTASLDLVSELVGHTSLVYSVAASIDGSVIASGSEDNTVKIWTPDGRCLQTLEHPGNVWAVAFLPNGDLVTGCSDGLARVWTMSSERHAPQDVITAYKEMLEALKKPAAADGAGGNGGLPEGLKLEDPVVLATPGARDGQTIIVKEGNGGVAYSWNAASNEWERIGEVVAGPDVGGPPKKWHNGREWDFVFDVDVQEGAPPLKLALNADENPYIVADRFIEAEGLSEGYREQIVQFILQNTAASTASTGGNTGAYVDPYTGASAYVPPPSTGGAQAANRSAAPTAVTGGGADPFTGTANKQYVHIPAMRYMEYNTLPNMDAIRKKILEFHPDLASNTEGLDSLLGAVSKEGGCGPLDASATAVLAQLLSAPPEALFPALDLARLAVTSRASYRSLDLGTGPITAEPFDSNAPGSLSRAVGVALAPPASAANQQTAIRLLCNSFILPGPREWVRANILSVLDAVSGCCSVAAKSVRQSLACLLINLCILLWQAPGGEVDIKTQILVLTAELISSSADDAEICYRALGTVGTLALENGKVRAAAKDLGLEQQAESFVGREGKLGDVAVEVCRVFRWNGN